MKEKKPGISRGEDMGKNHWFH